MSARSEIVNDLVNLSRWLGSPEQDCAILGEGNTSARVSADTFLVKASGTQLGTLEENGFVEVSFSRTLAMLDEPADSDEVVRQLLIGTKVDANDSRMPSVETAFHAVFLSLPGVNFVGHTHPTVINAMTCSVGFDKALQHRLFPDEVVVCGPEPLLIPYVDPGIVLARVIRDELQRFMERTGQHPKSVYMQNHGFTALGSTVKQVQAITAMAVKSARILQGTYAFGGPHPLGAENVERIHNRTDEHYRQRIIENR
ncbi:MAG: class II aldolase/adducin family protein [Bythopirellula sp.]|nr:class II aldolase/adducin family protein [Bythopirellula sp.]